jgi:hypothetical protein
MSSRLTRVIAVGFLLLALASSTLQALPLKEGLRGGPRAESSDLVTTVWQWLALIFAPNPGTGDGGESSARSKEGSQLDPDGHH